MGADCLAFELTDCSGMLWDGLDLNDVKDTLPACLAKCESDDELRALRTWGVLNEGNDRLYPSQCPTFEDLVQPWLGDDKPNTDCAKYCDEQEDVIAWKQQLGCGPQKVGGTKDQHGCLLRQATPGVSHRRSACACGRTAARTSRR